MNPVNSPDISNLTAEQKRKLLTQLMQQKAAKKSALTSTQKSKQTPEQNSDEQNSEGDLAGAPQSEGLNTAPLSFAQQRLWFIDQLQPNQTVYTIPAALRLQGVLQVKTLQRCLNEIVSRHEILRTQFVSIDGEPSQTILSQQDIELSVVELSGSEISESKLSGSNLPDAEPISPDDTADDFIAQLRPHLTALVEQSFDLATGPLLRSQLLKLGENDHILSVTVHHIIADYWSLKVLMKEIALLYQAFSSNQPSPLPALPIQYGDYAAWQHSQQAVSVESQLNYWLQQLAEPPAVLQLPTDHPRPAIQSFSGARRSFTLSPELSERLAQLAGRSQSTLFMTLLAAFQVLLYRYSGQSDILVGSTVSNRDRAETKDLIGLFVNNLVFRANVTANQTFTQFLARVRDTAISAYQNKDVPFEQVVDVLQVERQLSHNALFQVMFILHNTPNANFTLPDLKVTALELGNSAARFDLSLDMYEGPSGLTGVFEYNTDLFTTSTLDRLVAHFKTLLTGIVAQPETPIGALPLLTSTELIDLSIKNQTTVEIPEQCAHQLIEAQAEKTPEAISLSIGHIPADNGRSQSFPPEEPWTYQALNNRANQLAHYLKQYLASQGANPDSRIALAMHRSPELVIALLAILKIGGTYIPLDPTHPEARLQHILQDSGVSLILESEASLTTLISDLEVPILDLKQNSQAINQHFIENLAVDVSPQDLAYIIYTSGSTGKPKGVPIQHRSLVNLLTSMAKAPGIGTEDALLAVTTVAFDIATLELLLPLTVGARLVIATPETVRDSERLIAQLKSDDITLMQATPATWRLLLDAGWEGLSKLKILCGGEALNLPLAQQLLPCCHELWNLYGPTETTIWSSALRIDEIVLANGFVPIGGPIDNTIFHVLDPQQQPVPVGVPGELHIGGAGLSTGYLHRAELTAEKFVNTELPSIPHTTPNNIPHITTLYKTGDLVRRHSTGTLEYLGRLDHQIKLRGFRIELGEIESILNNHPDIDQSLVMLYRNGENHEPQLVAYCKVWPDVELVNNPTTLRQNLSGQLPTYMLPTAYVLLADFPLTPNGKIDRKALPKPQIGQLSGQPTTDSLGPQTETEQLIANIWADTLKIPAVRATDNFFELGGHSLLAARVIARLQPVLGMSVPLRTLFEKPTLSAFSTAIDATLQNKTFEPIQLIDREGSLPLSYAQKRQWVLAQLEPNSPFYNIPAAVRLVGDFSIPVLEESLAFLCDRHEGLRTTFQSVEGEANLQILPTLAPTLVPKVSYIEARNKKARNNALSESQITDRLIAESRKPFDLTTAPLMRVTVIRTEEQAYIVLLVLHHIIADAGSVDMLVRELVSVYTQRRAQRRAESPVVLPPLPVQYVDYAAWQQRLDTSKQLSYWQQQLAEVPPLLSLPTDYPRPAIQQFEGGSYRFALTAQQTAALKQLSQRHRATVFMTLMAAFQSLLHRYSGAEDLVVGTPIAHRPQAELEGVLGMFVNTLVLRGDFSEDITFTELLHQVRTTALSAYAHQDVPFEQVIDALNIPRTWSHSPLFQVMFVWQAAKLDATSAVDDLTWSPLTLDSNTTKVDLTLSMAEENAEDGVRLSGKFEYRRDLFKHGTIEAMADTFCTLLNAVTTSPEQLISELPLVSERQEQQLRAWNDTARDYPTGLCLHQLFEQQVARSPQAQALVTPTQTLSYQELNTRAHQLAEQLHSRGIGSDSRVAICLDRSANLIIAILAILKAGGAYVPLDPNYPSSRLAYILDDAQVSTVITQPEYENITASTPHTVVLTDVLTEQASPTTTSISHAPIPHSTREHNLAYIIYTSGSTGRPKGVAIEHHSPVALVQWANEVFSPDQLSGVLAATSVCFDLSIFEIFVPLSSGGSIILAENVLQLPTLPAAEQVTLINTVPTALAELARINGIPNSVTTINLAGEPIPPTLVKQLYALASVEQVSNLYGPSEDTTYSTYTLLSPEDATVPIGSPIANTQAYVLDQQQKQVPIGMPGELYLAGKGLAQGYWNQPTLTAESFIDCPQVLSPKTPTLYKTGDLVRYRPDGQLEFLGRLDNQVKIRGFRIELGEIESSLLQHSQVMQAAVKAWTDTQNNQRLVAYVVFAGVPDKEAFGKALSTISASFEGLRSHLQKSLPDYMLPAIVVPLEALPLLPNGKINRRALPSPIFETALKGKKEILTATEQSLVKIWQALLGQPVGIHDNFFELGGDSILAIQVIAQAQNIGLYFSPRDLFQYSTISQLAAITTTQTSNQAQQTPIVGPVALTPIQHWFLTQPLQHPHHWNQSVLLSVQQALRPDILEQALRQLMHHHDALRATFKQTKKGWEQSYQGPSETVPLRVIQRSITENEDAEGEEVSSVITTEAAAAQASFQLQEGPLLNVVYYDLTTPAGPERRLLIVCHHLLVDGISWRILLSDLQRLYQQLSEPSNQNSQLLLPPKTLSCQHWVKQLTITDFNSELPYWESIAAAKLPLFLRDFPAGNNAMATADTVSVSLTSEQTQRLIRKVPTAYSARIEDILLTALLLALSPSLSTQQKGTQQEGEETTDAQTEPSLRISLEGHGRPEDQDLSRTVGWLTTLYPVLLKMPSMPNQDQEIDTGQVIKSVKETLRSVPRQGMGYGVLRYLQASGGKKSLETDTPIRFNYLGQTDQLFTEDSWLAPASESAGAARSGEDPRDVLIEINAVISRGMLTLHWTFSREIHKKATISGWAESYLTQLITLIEYCLSTDTDQGYSPTDFPQMGLEQGELDDLLASLEGEMSEGEMSGGEMS
ncbi:MAG: amino acid adenylation domain-containing protein [Cyanobacteria bacterium P01_F01_bin.53]